MSWRRRARDPGKGAPPSGAGLAELIASLPEASRATALTHSSWTARRTDSYERLALLGDSVLGLALAEELYQSFPDLDAGELTKILNQAVSGASCAAVGEGLGIPDMLREAEPDGPDGTQTPARLLLEGERPLPEITEAMIGACFLEYGYGPTAAAVVDAFRGRVEEVRTRRTDFKSALQELAARSGDTVEYEVVSSHGPAHQRTYEVVVRLQDREIGRGEGRSKKAAGQAAAARALEEIGG